MMKKDHTSGDTTSRDAIQLPEHDRNGNGDEDENGSTHAGMSAGADTVIPMLCIPA